MERISGWILGSTVFGVTVREPGGEKNKVTPTLVVRGDSVVFRRERDRIGPAHQILTEAPVAEMEGISSFDGSLAELLGWVGSHVSAEILG